VSTEHDVRRIVEQAILDQPRSQQTLIGPSEIGIDCDRCLGHKLAGTPQRREAAWLPYIGTAMHAQLERVFLDAGLNGRWAAETRVWVGDIDGQEIHGSCDLLDAEHGTVVDFKLVGATTLTSARIGPSAQYRTQAHLYGRGWQHNGVEVKHVAIWYLPRNAVTLDNGIWWTEPYDEQIAIDALTRADALAQAIRILGAEQILPTLERKPGCYDCRRYPAYPSDPQPSSHAGPFSDLQPQLEGAPA
jgi:hypothetical protein